MTDLSQLDATAQAELVREDLLLRIASQSQTARPWADRRPPVHV